MLLAHYSPISLGLKSLAIQEYRSEQSGSIACELPCPASLASRHNGHSQARSIEHGHTITGIRGNVNKFYEYQTRPTSQARIQGNLAYQLQGRSFHNLAKYQDLSSNC